MRKEVKGLGKDLPFDEAQAGALSRQISDHVEIDSNRNIYYALYPTAITTMRIRTFDAHRQRVCASGDPGPENTDHDVARPELALAPVREGGAAGIPELAPHQPRKLRREGARGGVSRERHHGLDCAA